MNKKNRIFYMLALAGALAFSACNSSDETIYESEVPNYGGVAVTGFSLQKNQKVLNNLDSVFFSIDLNNALIFNANPLPYGTDVSALAVKVTADECKSLTINYTDAEGEAAEIDYLTDDDAKIDFSNGDVTLKIVSFDGEHSRDYKISVKVNTVVPDSLFWSEMACRELPGMAHPTVQRTVEANGNTYCLTYDGASYNMAVSGNLYAWNWTDSRAVAFPKPVDVRTLTGATSKLFILATDGELLTSADGRAWTGTGETWRSIVAPWDDATVLGLKMVGGVLKHVSYPASTETVASADFPVAGNSASVRYETKWAAQPQIVTTGGRKADGTLTGATWAFDGTSWVEISNMLPAAEGYAVTKYPICETDTMSWRLKVSDVMLAFGGKGTAGTMGRDVYVSRNMGMSWQKGGVSLQLPKYMPSVSGADLVVSSVELTADAEPSAANWLEMPVVGVDPYYSRMLPKSRIISATESWECPYIYMFGGVQDGGTLQNAVWRGVVNHFTFRPIE